MCDQSSWEPLVRRFHWFGEGWAWSELWRFRQPREKKQQSEWSQKRKQWEHLQSSKYIQFSCSVMFDSLWPHGVSILVCTEKILYGEPRRARAAEALRGPWGWTLAALLQGWGRGPRRPSPWPETGTRISQAGRLLRKFWASRESLRARVRAGGPVDSTWEGTGGFTHWQRFPENRPARP